MPLFRIDGMLVLFVHIPKTGGSSIEAGLRELGPMALHNKRGHPLPCPPQHLHAELLERILPEGFHDYAFTVVRNPFDRIFSEYAYRHGKQDGRIAPFDHWWTEVLSAFRKNPFVMSNHIRPQAEFVSEGTEAFAFEEGLSNVLEVVRERLGISSREGSLHHAKRSPGVEITVSPQTLDSIRETYAADFERFGYDQDPAAVLTMRQARLADAAPLQADGRTRRRVARFARRLIRIG